ncbi:MAG: hypothetical protein KDC07_07330 [Chitinophagaceae bacterium]|nr:hypothetical protein [Chitinophagaceae bacterium]MCB9047111.1 hypothetical protein [Chitinophagales bacterium]
MKLKTFILILTLALASCKGSNKVVTTNNTGNSEIRKKIACGKEHVEMNKAHIDWFEANNSILNKSTEVLVLPKDYKVYSIDTSQATVFFNTVGSGATATTVIPLPSPADCQVFTVKNNVKEGAHVTKGATMAVGECKGQTMGISYYMGKVAANVNWFGIEYELKTMFIQGEPYVIVYSKMPPPENNNKNKDKAKTEPEVIEIRYDK